MEIGGLNTGFTKTVSSRDHYMIFVLDALRALGGRALSGDVYLWLQKNGHARDHDLQTIQSDGGTRFHKEVRFARKELYDAGLITMPAYGDWELSAVGIATFLTPAGARALVGRRHGYTGDSSDQAGADREIVPARPTTGPVPTEWTTIVTRKIDRAAWTYIARFGQKNLWKIGQADDIRIRINELNRHLPTELYPETWCLFRTHPWSDVRSAYAMEQTLLRILGPYRTQGERVVCETVPVCEAWAVVTQETK